MRYSSHQNVRVNPRSFVDTTVHFRKSATRTVILQPKVLKINPAETRLKTLSELFYDTFCGDLRPKAGPRAKARPDYMFHARPFIKRLAAVGGPGYEHAVSALKYAYLGETPVEQEEAYRAAVTAVIPPLK
jgi:hypothetical protein